jgi:hypothetical protein
MTPSLLQQYQRTSSLRIFFTHYWTICGLLNRKDDLEQLVRWADSKHLIGPRNVYRSLVLEIERLLWKYQHRSPIATSVARFAVNLNKLLNSHSLEYRKGYASRYKRVNSLAE